MKLTDLTGQKFGRLTVLKRATSRTYPSGQTHTTWLCRCDCGTETVIPTAHLRSGHTQSCGCYRSDTTISRSKKHGMRHSPLYGVWVSMMKRCRNPKCKCYHNYGGRGIRVCENWLVFEHFFSDMGPSYKQGLELDRIDVDGDYCPENCRWVTKQTNSRNRRDSLWVTVEPFGRIHLMDLAERVGIPYTTLKYRYHASIPLFKAEDEQKYGIKLPEAGEML